MTQPSREHSTKLELSGALDLKMYYWHDTVTLTFDLEIPSPVTCNTRNSITKEISIIFLLSYETKYHTE